MLCLQALIYRSNNSLSVPRAVSWQSKNIRTFDYGCRSTYIKRNI